MHFERISREQWTKDVLDIARVDKPTKEELEKINAIYENIKIPRRATKHSAGIDFFMPDNVIIPMEGYGLVPTGVRWVCDKEEDKDKVLQIYPRSGMGFRTGVRLANTVGIIDADYYNADNEGHIMIKMYNPLGLHTTPTGNIQIKANEAFAQGIITKFYTCDEDEVEEERTGGFGSTDKDK